MEQKWLLASLLNNKLTIVVKLKMQAICLHFLLLNTKKEALIKCLFY